MPDRLRRVKFPSIGLILVWRVLSAVAGFLATLVIARRLGVEAAGTFFLSVALVSVAATVSRLGLDMPVMRLVATEGQREGGGAQREVMRTAIYLSGIVAMLFTAILVLGAGFAETLFNDPELGPMLAVVALATTPIALGSILSRGLMSVGSQATAEFGQRAGQQLTFVLLVFVIGSTFDGVGAGIAFSVSFLAMLGILGTSWTMATTVSTSKLDGIELTVELMKSGVPLLVVASTNLVMTWSDTIMIGFFLTPEEVGVYSAASRMAGTVAFALVASSAVFGPEFARKLDRADQAGFESDFRTAASIAGGAAVAIGAPMTIFASDVLSVFGSAFVGGVAALRVLVLGQILNCLAGLVVVALAMGRRESKVLLASAMASVVNVGLNLVLIPRWGVVGAACATSASVVVYVGQAAFWAQRELKVSAISLLSYPRR